MPSSRRGGSGDDLADCQLQFKAAWAKIRAGLTDADITAALAIAEASREAIGAIPEAAAGLMAWSYEFEAQSRWRAAMCATQYDLRRSDMPAFRSGHMWYKVRRG
jgi:hypothetical protein